MYKYVRNYVYACIFYMYIIYRCKLAEENTKYLLFF